MVVSFPSVEGKKMKQGDEKRTMYPQLECGRLFIEKSNTCPNRTRKIHNVPLGVGDQIKKRKKIIFLL